MSTQTVHAEYALFAGGGEMGERMQAYDWASSPLGSPDQWPQSLRTALRICLDSRFGIVIFWGPDLRLFYNDDYRSMLGGKHPAALGQPGRDVWREVWPTVGPMLQQVIESGRATWSDNLLLLMERYGYTEESYFTFSYSPIRSETGEVNGVFCPVTETTERVIGERRLRTLRDLAARSFEAKTVEGVCQLLVEILQTNPADLPFALVYVLNESRTRARLAGAAGLTAGALASPEEVDLHDDKATGWPLSRVARTGLAEQVDDLADRFGPLPGGVWPESPRSALVLPIARLGHSLPVALLVAAVSPRRALDRDYRFFLDAVAQQAATSLTEALAQEEEHKRLEDEQKRAEALAELDRAKTAFFSNVSHEFRTPLTLMLGPLEALLARGDATLTVERPEVELVHRNGLRLLKLVNTLLDFVRIEAGRLQVRYEPTDLAHFTTELSSVFRSTCERAGVQLVVDCPPLPAPVSIDREMWERIVLNLLSNAVKFTLSGTITVRLTAGDAHVTLTVSDTGVGIPAAELPHLFERFHRVSETKGRTQEGMGIGLALVQELVRLHGGTVQADSVEGQGSVFTVTIPRSAAHLPTEQSRGARPLASAALSARPYIEEALLWLPKEEISSNQASMVNSEEEARGWRPETSPAVPQTASVKNSELHTPNLEFIAQHSTSRARILLADDNADMQDYVRRLLSEHYDVTTVADGQEALASAIANPPDLVLSDVMMPRLDGFGLLKALRAHPRTRTLPILLLTARAGEESQIEGLEAGADDYLVKPFSARELLARVSTRLEIAHLRQEIAHREHRLRQEAEAARERVTTTLESITDAFYTLDHQWRFTYVNQRAKELWRRPHEDFTGKNFWTEFPEVERFVFGEQLRKAAAEQVAVDVEGFYPSLELWLTMHVYPSSEGLTIYFQDITARKQAEEASLRLAAIVESSDDAIVSKSLDGVVTSWNAAAERLFGYRAEEMIGQPILRLLPAERQDEERMILEQLRRGERIDHFETVRQTKDGRFIDVSVTISPLRNAQGIIIGASKIARDITARKQAEAEREQLLAELQRVNAELQQFAYIVSHDLNEPLRTMHNYIQLLARRTRGKLEAAATEYIAFITDAAQHMQQMLTALLAYTRLGGQTGTFTTVDCEAVLTRVLTALQLQITECGAVITHDPLPTVHGNAMLLGQVLQNLIGNALKFCKAPPPRVHITGQREETHWRFAVRDNGIGIDPQQAGRLFQIFQRLHTRSEYPGTGIGLAICKKIVEQHGGRIWVESRPGEGSVFYFTLRDLQRRENNFSTQSREQNPTSSSFPLSSGLS